MADHATNPFSPRVIVAIVLAGVVSFLGFLLLVAYAPQLRMRAGEGATPMSRSAVGFYGLYKLAEATGRPVDLHGDRGSWRWTGLTIVTLEMDTDAAALTRMIAARTAAVDATTLYILPKWITQPLLANPRWVQRVAFAGPPPPVLKALGDELTVSIVGRARSGGRITHSDAATLDGFVAAQPAVAASIKGIQPVLRDDDGRTVLGRIQRDEDSVDYILADPDLLNNIALKTPEGARNALRIVDAMRNSSDDSVAFDLALNGDGNQRNLLQLMFEPPFLALTLAVLAAALLAGWHGFNRFGPALAEPRAVPFGKRALADNAAVLIARAGATRRMGDRYVALVRESVANALGAGAMDAAAQERWLAALPGVSGLDFGALAANARDARSGEAMRAAAAALHKWRNEVTRDR